MKLVIRKPRRDKLYIGLLLTPLLKMAVMSMLPQYEFIFNMLLVAISIGLLSQIMAMIAGRHKASSFAVFLVLYNFFMLPFSVSGTGVSFAEIASFYGSALYHVTFCLAILLALRTDSRNLIHTWSNIMQVLVVANALSVIIFPQGLYTQGQGFQLVKYWILGYDNDHVIPYIVTLLLVMLDNYINSSKVFSKKVYLLFGLCIGTSLYLWSVTAFISLIIMAILCLLYSFATKHANIFNIRTFIIIIFVTMMFVYVLALSGGGLFQNLLVNLLRKDMTFNSRSWIWANYLVNIRSHLLFGNGNETAATLIAKNGVHGAHNEWIQMLYDGGLMHIFFYFAMLYCVSKKLMKKKKTVPAYLCSVSIFAIMIIQMMVGCPKFYWLLLFTIGYSCESIKVFDGTKLAKRRKM